MKAPPVTLNGTGVLAVAGLVVVGYLAFKAYRAGASIMEGARAVSKAVSLDTTLPDSAYADPAAQEQAAAALGQAGGDNLLSYYWHKLTGAPVDAGGGVSAVASEPPFTGGATGLW